MDKLLSRYALTGMKGFLGGPSFLSISSEFRKRPASRRAVLRFRGIA